MSTLRPMHAIRSRRLLPLPALAGPAAALVLLVPLPRAQALPGEAALLMEYAQSSLPAAGGVDDLVAGDLDGDGDVDVVSAHAASNAVRVRLNDGTGAFVTQSIALAGSPAALALADFDEDGDLDLAVGLQSQWALLLNDGAGHLALGQQSALPAGDLGSTDAFASDLDGDGHLDLLLGISDLALGGGGYTGGAFVAFGDGAGHLANGPTSALVLPVHRLVAADLDGDGRLDLAQLGGYVSASTVALAFGAGDGTFAVGPSTWASGLYAQGLAAGDWDGDGDTDLANGNKYTVNLLVNDGAGAFASGTPLAIGSYVKGLQAGDLDHDGDLDLLATSGSASALRLLANDGAGHFATSHSFPASVQTLAVLLADVNGDGYLDPFAGDYTSGALTYATSHVLVARYGPAQPSGAGCVPVLSASGSPSIAGSGFGIAASDLPPAQPALVLVGLAPALLPALGGFVLVAPPWVQLPAATTPGAGACDGGVALDVPGAALAPAGVGTRLYLQVLAADPDVVAGPAVALTDGLWFEVVP